MNAAVVAAVVIFRSWPRGSMRSEFGRYIFENE